MNDKEDNAVIKPALKPTRQLLPVALFATLACSGCSNNVTVMPTATALHSTDTTNVAATVVSNNNPVIATTVTFSSGTNGTVAPLTANTDTQGVANTTFTAGAVTQDTPVTVTAKAGAQGSTVITVKPVVGFDDFGTGTATGAATAQVTVSPSVVVGNGIQCTYDIVHNTSVGAAASPITVTVNFDIPMRLVSATSPEGTVSSNSTGGGTAWIFWIPDPSYT